MALVLCKLVARNSGAAGESFRGVEILVEPVKFGIGQKISKCACAQTRHRALLWSAVNAVGMKRKEIKRS